MEFGIVRKIKGVILSSRAAAQHPGFEKLSKKSAFSGIATPLVSQKSNDQFSKPGFSRR
jgi:hypothetical protein